MTPSVRQRLWIWLAGSAVGGAVLALPDTGPRLVSFSETHGPSALDLVGMIVLVGSWVPIVALIWSRRDVFREGVGRGAGGLALAGAALLVVTIAFDIGAWWIAAVVMLLGAQVIALWAIAARPEAT